MSIDSFLLLILTVCFGVLGFLLARLITRNDKFQDDTTTHFRGLRLDITRQERAISDLRITLSKEIEVSGFDQKTKAKMSSLSLSLAKIETSLSEIKPIVEASRQNQGKIIWITDRIAAQDKKLQGLYDVVIKVVNSQKR